MKIGYNKAEERIKELNAHFCLHSEDGSCSLAKSEVKTKIMGGLMEIDWHTECLGWRKQYDELEAQLKLQARNLAAKFQLRLEDELAKKLPSKEQAEIFKSYILNELEIHKHCPKDDICNTRVKKLKELLKRVEEWIK